MAMQETAALVAELLSRTANIYRSRSRANRAVDKKAADLITVLQARIEALEAGLRDTANALETVLSSDPDMPTHQADYDVADQQLERARELLKGGE